MEEPTLNHPSVKLVLVGEAGTGKTCIFTRLCKGKFDSDTSTSIGALGETITLTCSNNFKIKFNIWDTAGQEIYHSVNKIFYTDAKIVLIVYDVTVAKSFDAIKNYWYEQVSESCGKSTILCVVGNKIDLVEKETVDEEEVVRFAKEKGIKYKRVSALSGVNINEMFKELADEYINSDDNVLSGMKINLLNKVKGKKGKKYC